MKKLYMNIFSSRKYNSIIHHQSLRLLSLHGCATTSLYPTPNPQQNRRDHLSHNPDGNRTHRTPNLHAHRSYRRLGERQNPLHVVGKPARRESEDGGGIVTKLKEKLESAGAYPAADLDAPVEGGFVCAYCFVCCWYTLAPALSPSPLRVMVIHTRRLIILQSLIMSSTNLGPFRKLILRAGIVQVAFQLENFALEAIRLAALSGYRSR